MSTFPAYQPLVERPNLPSYPDDQRQWPTSIARASILELNGGSLQAYAPNAVGLESQIALFASDFPVVLRGTAKYATGFLATVAIADNTSFDETVVARQDLTLTGQIASGTRHGEAADVTYTNVTEVLKAFPVGWTVQDHKILATSGGAAAVPSGMDLEFHAGNSILVGDPAPGTYRNYALDGNEVHGTCILKASDLTDAIVNNGMIITDASGLITRVVGTIIHGSTT